MGLLANLNGKMKKLSYIDLKLIEGACIVIGIILVSLIPQLLNVKLSHLIVLLVILCLKPMYVFWIKK